MGCFPHINRKAIYRPMISGGRTTTTGGPTMTAGGPSYRALPPLVRLPEQCVLW